jgi:hypothetical protein
MQLSAEWFYIVRYFRKTMPQGADAAEKSSYSSKRRFSVFENSTRQQKIGNHTHSAEFDPLFANHQAISLYFSLLPAGSTFLLPGECRAGYRLYSFYG